MPENIHPQLADGPTEDTYVIGKPDIAAIVGYVSGLQDWIVAAAGCLKAGQ